MNKILIVALIAAAFLGLVSCASSSGFGIFNTSGKKAYESSSSNRIDRSSGSGANSQTRSSSSTVGRVRKN